MRSTCLLIRRLHKLPLRYSQRRNLLTIAIESSCDDTSVAVLERHKNRSATLHFHTKVTSDNREFRGVHPIIAHESHQRNIAALLCEGIQNLPAQNEALSLESSVAVKGSGGEYILRKKPDFVTVTRGPGMRAGLMMGMDTAKGLALAWQVPLLGVNHMHAHALTPRLVAALTEGTSNADCFHNDKPAFPFLTLLISGGHTMLVHSRSLTDHEIIANTTDIPIGNSIDKCGRDLLPPSYIAAATNVMYGRMLETFAFPDEPAKYEYTPPSTFFRPKEAVGKNYKWHISPPYGSIGASGAAQLANTFSYSGLGSTVKRIMSEQPNMQDDERRTLALLTMEVAFEHLSSRVLLALQRPDMKSISTLVVSGGVASNQYLKHILRTQLDAKGHKNLKMIFPPPDLCTDNAAMVAWTGIEMYEAGLRTKMDSLPLRKWAIDPRAEDGGILGVDGWEKVDTECLDN